MSSLMKFIFMSCTPVVLALLRRGVETGVEIDGNGRVSPLPPLFTELEQQSETGKLSEALDSSDSSGPELESQHSSEVQQAPPAQGPRFPPAWALQEKLPPQEEKKLLKRDTTEPWTPPTKLLKRDTTEPWTPPTKLLKRDTTEPWTPPTKLLREEATLREGAPREEITPWKPVFALLKKEPPVSRPGDHTDSPGGERTHDGRRKNTAEKEHTTDHVSRVERAEKEHTTDHVSAAQRGKTSTADTELDDWDLDEVGVGSCCTRTVKTKFYTNHQM